VREILTAFGFLTADRNSPFQAGVLALHDRSTELLFVTLDKSVDPCQTERAAIHARVSSNHRRAARWRRFTCGQTPKPSNSSSRRGIEGR
jgi:hypothetical protein